MPEDTRAGSMLNSDLGATHVVEVCLSHVSARAIEAVCLLIDDSLDLETLMQVIPCCCFVGMNSRSRASSARMDEAAWLFELKTGGTELPPRLRTITTTLRLPL